MATSRRLTQPRSRNGCTTCKIRHVKCDEKKPACTQCQKSGRKCDGYENASQAQLRQRIQERHRPIERDTFRADQRLVLRQETRTERRYVDFFYTKTSHVFSGLYKSKLWSYLIPQFGEHEPSVRHAMTAIGAIHSRLQITDAASKSEDTGPTERFVLEEYNKSIQGLVKSLSAAKGESVDLALTSCCLFVCLEILRFNRRAALDHIEAGLRIIYKHEQTSAGAWTSELYQQLRDLFIRLNLQASFMGGTLVPLKLYSSETVQSGLAFNDMIEARNQLDQAITRGLLFIRSVGIMREAREPAFQLELEIEQEKVHRELLAWRQSHDKLLHKLGPKIQESELCASLLQRIYYSTALIWSLVVLDRSEDSYDSFTAEFETVISHIEKLLQINPSFGNSKTHTGASQPSFSLENGIIAPAYFAACRCRHPSVRRRAQNILFNYSNREGMWNARLYATIAKLVTEIEESQCAVPPTSESDIGPTARVYEEVQMREEKDNPMHVRVYTKPDGVDGPWEMTNFMVEW